MLLLSSTTTLLNFVKNQQLITARLFPCIELQISEMLHAYMKHIFTEHCFNFIQNYFVVIILSGFGSVVCNNNKFCQLTLFKNGYSSSFDASVIHIQTSSSL